MEEESDGPDVVAIGLRETATSGVAGAETDASRGGASALFAGIDASPSLPSLGEQREQLEPLLPLLTKNQKQKLRQKRCRLAKRLRMQQGDSTEDPLVVADVRTPTATPDTMTTAAAFARTTTALPPSGQKRELQLRREPLLCLSGSGVSTQDRVTVDSVGVAPAGSGGGRGRGRGRSSSGGGGGARKEATAGTSGLREEDEEGSSFLPLQQRRSRHTKFDDDDDGGDDEDDEGDRRHEKADDEPLSQQQQRKKRQRSDDEDDGEENEEAPPPAAAAPCRLDLSLTAATIAVALRSSAQSDQRAASQAEREKKSNVSRPAPRGNYSRYYGYRLGLHALVAHPVEMAAPSHQADSPQQQQQQQHHLRLLSPAHEALYGPGAADPRLRSLLPYLGLFRGRRLLDVGCNGGVLTLALAAAAGVSSALGVDADGRLVRSARARCRRMRESAAAWERGLRVGKEAFERDAPRPPSPPSHSPLLPEPGGRSVAGKRAAARACSRALRAAEFRHEDFVAIPSLSRDGGGGGGGGGGGEERGGEERGGEERGGEERGDRGREGEGFFGAALCLSVTKWIHLSHGDAGIERLFARLSRCLSKGAHLVLEPQPWRSYQRAVKKKGVREALLSCSSPSLPNGSSDDASSPPPQHRTLASLKIRPDDFVSILEQPRYGFVLVRSLGAPEGAAPGFDRPLLLFRKR